MGLTHSSDKVAVLFDFDGTIGDTETPAMEVAYWEIAPYLPNISVSDLEGGVTEYVRNNAGKAFEFMVEACDKDRKAAGLKTTSEEARKAREENPDVLIIVNKHRREFGLKTFEELRAPGGGELPTLLQQQKEETVEALSKVAQPCPGIPQVLAELRKGGTQFCIATTSPKPRVPASITACGLDEYFPADKVHSGESDFNPPRFKPDPSVYLKAAKAEHMKVQDCVAVEDSGSGVGSAANAKIGFIVGYVGGSHVPDEKANTHAEMLMSGSRSKDGRGADVVISDMADLLKLVSLFKDSRAKGVKGPPAMSSEFLQSLKQPIWLSKRLEAAGGSGTNGKAAATANGH